MNVALSAAGPRDRAPGEAGELILDVLAERARREGDRIAFSILAAGRPAADLSYAALDRAARALASALGRHVRPRQRVLLALPPGTEFPVALFGALYAGAIAVPTVLPDPRRIARTLPRLRAVAADARPAAALTTAACVPLLARSLEGAAAHLGALPVLAVDSVDPALAEQWRRPGDITASSLACLQYTSGSTAAPRGVMISHGALLAGAACLRDAWGYEPASRALMWVPDVHDDGLVQGNVLPVFCGHRCWRMAAADIVRRPRSWLEAISDLGITHSGGPNFVYELCLRKADPAAGRSLDLSTWRMAYDAAEPVRAATLRRFAETYGSCGFAARSFHPAYGLAEATLLVTTRRPEAMPRILDVDAGELERAGRIVRGAGGVKGRQLVSCGMPCAGIRVEVADPESLAPCAERVVGEVLVGGPSLADGYWGLPEETRATFLSGRGDPAERLLRTGDLGFLDGGELFLTGRRKDLIILRGRNIYPQDVELSAEGADPAVRPGCGAAFSIDRGDEEQLVVVQEVEMESAPAPRELCRRIFERIVEEHDVRPSAIVSIPPRTLAKTTSGKVQRGACRAAFLAGRLAVLASYPETGGGHGATPDEQARAPEPAVDGAELAAWLRTWSEERLDLLLMDERRSLPPHVVLDLGNRGIFGLSASRAYGGLGLGAAATARVLQQLGAIDLTLASFVLGQNALGTRPIERYAGEALRRRLLPALTSGRQLSALALSEAGAGSNPRAMTAAGRWDDGASTWRLSGTKLWSGSAAWAGVIHVFARVDGGPGGRSGITGFVLERPKPGLRVGCESLTMGHRATVQSTVHLDRVPVREAELLGAPGEGMEVAQDAFGLARLGLGAIAVGGMKRCAQLMTRYARRRPVASGILIEHPVVLHRLSELAAAVTALESLVDSCTRSLDESAGELSNDAAMVCKIAGAEWLWQAADTLVQTLGGRGYVETNLAPRLLRDARLFRIFEGPTEVLLDHLGSRALQGEPALLSWLACRDPQGADEVRQAAAAARPRDAGGWQAQQRRRWLQHRLGELTHWAVLRAAVREARGRGGDSHDLEHAETWLALRFAQLRSRLAGGAPAADDVLTGDGMSALVERYGEAIGDLQSEPPGEDRALDPLLRKMGAGAPDAGAAAGAGAEAEAKRWDGMVRVDAPPALAGAAGEIEAWLIDWIARHLEIERTAVDCEGPFSLFLDSVVAVTLMDDLATWLGRPLDASLPWSFPTIRALSREVAAPLASQPEVNPSPLSGAATEAQMERG